MSFQRPDLYQLCIYMCLWVWLVAHSFLRIACQWAVCYMTKLPPILCEIVGCESLIKWVQAKMKIRYGWVGRKAQLLTGSRLHHIPWDDISQHLEGRSRAEIQANYSLIKLPNWALKPWWRWSMLLSWISSQWMVQGLSVQHTEHKFQWWVNANVAEGTYSLHLEGRHEIWWFPKISCGFYLVCLGCL